MCVCVYHIFPQKFSPQIFSLKIYFLHLNNPRTPYDINIYIYIYIWNMFSVRVSYFFGSMLSCLLAGPFRCCLCCRFWFPFDSNEKKQFSALFKLPQHFDALHNHNILSLFVLLNSVHFIFESRTVIHAMHFVLSECEIIIISHCSRVKLSLAWCINVQEYLITCDLSLSSYKETLDFRSDAHFE